MGCDIHCYIEYKKPDSDRWYSFGRSINPGRWYTLFERLAGVRGEPEKAIVKPRGIPDDLAFFAEDDWWLFIVDDCSDEAPSGMCTRKQARDWHKLGSRYKADREGFTTWVEHPDWHTPSWVTPDEWQEATKEANEEYHAMLAAMRELERHGNSCRVVFWFDN